MGNLQRDLFQPLTNYSANELLVRHRDSIASNVSAVIFVSKLTYSTDSRVMDFAETIVSDDTLRVRYLKAVYLSVIKKAYFFFK